MRTIPERDGTGAPAVSYTRGNDPSASMEGAGGIGGLLARSSGYSGGNFTTNNFYFADGNGNITYMLNSSQAMVASYRYDPFGNTISSSGTLASANVYRFSSKEIHANSGMYYYGYRFYDPNLQRWINRDPVRETGFEALRFRRGYFTRRTAVFDRLEGINLYEFVQNEPTLRYDCLGLVSSACLSAIEQAEAANAALAAAISAGNLAAIPGLSAAVSAASLKMAAACSDPNDPKIPPITIPIMPPSGIQCNFRPIFPGKNSPPINWTPGLPPVDPGIQLLFGLGLLGTVVGLGVIIAE